MLICKIVKLLEFSYNCKLMRVEHSKLLSQSGNDVVTEMMTSEAPKMDPGHTDHKSYSGCLYD